MANPTGSRACGVCGAPEAVRQFIDSALTAEPRTKTLRELEKETAFSKATLSRHRARCLPRSAAHAHRGASSGNRPIFWLMDDGSFRPEDSDDIAERLREDQLPENAIVIGTQFRAREITNPGAHLSHSSREQRAEKRRQAKNRAETPVDATQGESQALQSQEPVPVESASPAPAEPSPQEPSPPQNCVHDLKRVSGDTFRCQKCGFEPPANIVPGQSRREFFDAKNSKGLFGRG